MILLGQGRDGYGLRSVRVLIEYDNMQGMVPFTELSRSRIRSISKHIKVGANEVMAVLRVDKERRYVDLSKKKVAEDERRMCQFRFGRAKTVHGILQSCALSSRGAYPMESLCTVIAWPLYQRSCVRRFQAGAAQCTASSRLHSHHLGTEACFKTSSDD